MEEGLNVSIRVAGRLGAIWSDWFNGLEIHPESEDLSLLTGRLSDQAALLQVLNQLHALNLTLISFLLLPEKAK